MDAKWAELKVPNTVAEDTAQSALMVLRPLSVVVSFWVNLCNNSVRVPLMLETSRLRDLTPGIGKIGAV